MQSYSLSTYQSQYIQLLIMVYLRILATSALFRLIVSSTTNAPESSREFAQQAASLFALNAKPTASDIDALTKSLYLSPEYHQISRVERMDGIQIVEMVDSIAVKPPIRAKATAIRASSSLVTPDPSTGAGIMLPSDPTMPPPSDSTLKAITYIVTTIDSLSHLMLVINRVDADLKAENYAELVKEFDMEFNPLLARLANEAADRLFTSQDTAATWKSVVWQLHLTVANYVSEKKGFEEWSDFKGQVLATLGKLLDYAFVAKAASKANTPPAPGTSNAALEQQLEEQAVETTCLCIFSCLSRVCGSASSVRTTPRPVVATTAMPGEYQGPSAAARKTLELVLFIESTVESFKSVIDEIHLLDSSGTQGQERMLNLKLRIALRLTNLLKQAIATGGLDDIYDALKSKGVMLLGSLSGVGSVDGWESIKHTVAEVLAAIISDLNASKPTDVI
jgi:hypothetical protein